MPKTKYEANSGQIHQVVMDADRIAVAGTPPAGAVTSSIRAKVSKSNREYGIRPRGVRLGREIGTAPDTFVKYSFLPVLTPAAFATAAFALSATITYGGFTWEVIARVSEDF